MQPQTALLLAALATGLSTALLARCEDAAAGAVKLPDGFIIGAGTAAFQAEGAWNVSGE